LSHQNESENGQNAINEFYNQQLLDIALNTRVLIIYILLMLKENHSVHLFLFFLESEFID